VNRDDPQVRDNAAASRLEAMVEGQTGYAEYQLTSGTITFTHTRVPENLRGRGIGTRLIEAGLALARERGLEVVPVCPFFRAYMRAHPDSQGLLGAAGRKLLAEPG
jgi:uncharacterized protein